MNNTDIHPSFYVQWHILDRCNLRCRHCYQYNFSSKDELGWPKLQTIANNLLHTMAVWKTRLDVALTGGEPFLEPGLFPLLRYLNDSPLVQDLAIISNGTIFPDYAPELSSLKKLKEIRISLDGISEATNAYIRGQGVLQNVLTNISRFQDLGIPITTMFTVMKQNQHETPFLIDWGKKIGIKAIIIERFFPLGQGEDSLENVLDGPGFYRIWQQILEQVEVSADPGELIPYRAIRIDFDKEEIDVSGSGCVVARDGMALLPGGTILPCRRFLLPIGNILEEPLEKIWLQSPVLNALRDRNNLKGKCRDCSIEECQGCRAMCYTLEKDFLAQDPHCWLIP